jgi:hypothetical protein
MRIAGIYSDPSAQPVGHFAIPSHSLPKLKIVYVWQNREEIMTICRLARYKITGWTDFKSCPKSLLAWSNFMGLLVLDEAPTIAYPSLEKETKPRYHYFWREIIDLSRTN